LRLRTFTARCVAAAGLLALAACESDDFADTGSGMPLDVSQDSVLVEAPAVRFERIETVEPETSRPYVDRQTLFLGNRERGGFRATPVIRFNFDEEVLRDRLRERLEPETSFDYAVDYSDTVQFDADFVANPRIQLALFEREVPDEGDVPKPPRSIRVTSTAAAIQTEDATVESIDELLGDEITEFEQTQSDRNYEIPLPEATVRDWIAASGHDGVALFDLAPGDETFEFPNESNIIAFAGRGFGRAGSELVQTEIDESIEPEILLDLAAVDESGSPLSDIVIGAPALIDFTVIERDSPPGGGGLLSSHDPVRTWIELDLDDGVVPRNATINRAVLTLRADPEGTLGTPNRGGQPQNLTVLCYESRLSDATRENPGRSIVGEGIESLIFVDGAALSILDVPILELDITAYVQRVVNGVVDPDRTGLLILFDSEEFDFDTVNFHGPDSPFPDQRPTVRVTFTPPADSWR